MKKWLFIVLFATALALAVWMVLAAPSPSIGAFVADRAGSMTNDHRDRIEQVSANVWADTDIQLMVVTVNRTDDPAHFVAAFFHDRRIQPYGQLFTDSVAAQRLVVLLYTASPASVSLHFGEEVSGLLTDRQIAEFEAGVLESIEGVGESRGIMNGYGALVRHLYRTAGVEMDEGVAGLLTTYPGRGEGAGTTLDVVSPVFVIAILALSGWGMLVAARSRRRLKEWSVRTYAGHVSTRRSEDAPSEDDHHSYQAFQTGGQLEVYPEEKDVYVEKEIDDEK